MTSFAFRPALAAFDAAGASTTRTPSRLPRPTADISSSFAMSLIVAPSQRAVGGVAYFRPHPPLRTAAASSVPGSAGVRAMAFRSAFCTPNWSIGKFTKPRPSAREPSFTR